MRRKATLVVLGILLHACGFEKEQFLGDAALPPVTVGFLQTDTLQDENSGPILVVVRLSRPAPEPISVNYAFTGGSALLDTDYSGTDGTLSWAQGETDQFIPLTIILDTVEEENETIELTLSAPSNAALGSAHHTITISKKNLPRVNFSAAVSDADETGNITVELTLDSPPDLESSATIAYKMTSTAAIGFDWAMPTSSTVTFPVNTLTKTITIPVMNDGVDEDDETVLLEILSTTNVVIGTVKDRTHTIHDDDNPPSVSISTAAGATTEGNTGSQNVNITVTLSGPSGKLVTVPVAFAGGTATENSDYSYLSKTDLVFTPNQNPAMSETTKMVTISIASDVIDEDNQTIITSLTATPTNATLSTTLPLSHTQTITDDDTAPTVNFITGNMSEPEGDDGTAAYNYVFELTAASERPIAWDVTLGGAATIPSDYSTTPAAAAGNVRMTINPGATQATLTLTVIGDEVHEGNTAETITMDISMSNLLNVIRGAQRTRVHTIPDSDQ